MFFLKRLIHESLSKFASFNFAIHTLAQPKTANSSNYFSFLNHTFNAEMDGRIKSINIEKNILTPSFNSFELYKCLVTRENDYETNQVYRTFDEFCELYQLLVKIFPVLKLPNSPPISKFKEAKNIYKRRQYIESLINDIMSLQPEISHVNFDFKYKNLFIKLFKI